MDPDTNLREQIVIAQRIVDGLDEHEDPTRLAQLVLALDRWLLSGGFKPARWQQPIR